MNSVQKETIKLYEYFMLRKALNRTKESTSHLDHKLYLDSEP